MSNERHVFSRPVDHQPAHVAGAEAVSKLISHWRAILGLLGAFIVLGFMAAHWESSHATKLDLGVTTAATQALDKRVTVTEERVKDIKAVLDRMDAQLFEIAKATGARTISQP